MNNRKRYEWKLRDRTLLLGERTLIMGILNVTPDSFSDGGQFINPEDALNHALQMEADGADIIDIGAESTRPGAQRVSEPEELRRLIPVLKRLKGRLAVPVSVDTYKSGVAEKALEHGADIINDPSGLTFDPALARVSANYNSGLILNHMRGTPDQWAKLAPMVNVMGTIADELDATVHRATGSGVERIRMVVDPGLGFGKRKEQNSEILARLPALFRLELPILIGPSRKGFLGQTTTNDADFATAAALVAGVFGGAHLVRVHNVREMKIAAQVVDQVLAGMPEPEAPPAPKPTGRKRFAEDAGTGRSTLRPTLRRP